MSEVDDDEPVGYGRPPRHSRFRPGHSGNPSGRPKGARSLKSDLADELSQLVQVSENGTRIEVTKQRLAVKALTAKAIKGHVAATAKLFDFLRETQGFGEEADGGTANRLDEDDETVIAAWLERMNRGSADG